MDQQPRPPLDSVEDAPKKLVGQRPSHASKTAAAATFPKKAFRGPKEKDKSSTSQSQSQSRTKKTNASNTPAAPAKLPQPKPKAAAPKKTAIVPVTTRPHRAPALDGDEDEDEEQSAQQHSHSKPQRPGHRDDNEDSEQPESPGGSDSADDERGSKCAQELFADETPQIIDHGAEPNFRCSHSRCSSRSSGIFEFPPSSDADDLGNPEPDGMEDDEERQGYDDIFQPPSPIEGVNLFQDEDFQGEHVPPLGTKRRLSKVILSDEEEVADDEGDSSRKVKKAKGLTKARKQKLEDELPNIMFDDVASASHPQVSIKWLPRTGIKVVEHVRSFTMDMAPQTHEIQAVLRKGIAMANVDLFFKPTSMVDPLAAGVIEEMSLKACIAAAEKLGFNGQGDIAHQLEGDNATYQTPVSKLVAHRVAITRTAIKTDALPVIYSALGIKPSDTDILAALVKDNNLIYPMTVIPGHMPTFDTARMFQSTVIVEVVKTAFFSGTANSKVVQGQPEFFQSATPNEPEVPAMLIAWACTAIFAVIDQHLRNVTKAPFADALLGAQFQAFMALLKTLKEKKAKVSIFPFQLQADHVCSGALPNATLKMTREQLINSVAWDDVI